MTWKRTYKQLCSQFSFSFVMGVVGLRVAYFVDIRALYCGELLMGVPVKWAALSRLMSHFLSIVRTAFIKASGEYFIKTMTIGNMECSCLFSSGRIRSIGLSK